MKNNYGVWDLEHFKVTESNKYENIIDKDVQFDYRNRERAIATLFETTKDSNVKQVLRFAMELQNQYRSEAMNLYNALLKVDKKFRFLRRLTNDALNDVYL